MEKNITVLKGDGIGPEIVDQAIKVLDAVCEKYSHKFNYTEVDIGGCSIDKYGVPITEEGMAKYTRVTYNVAYRIYKNAKNSGTSPKGKQVAKKLGTFVNYRTDTAILPHAIVGSSVRNEGYGKC